jgi:hypothetical protein
MQINESIGTQIPYMDTGTACPNTLNYKQMTMPSSELEKYDWVNPDSELKEYESIKEYIDDKFIELQGYCDQQIRLRMNDLEKLHDNVNVKVCNSLDKLKEHKESIDNIEENIYSNNIDYYDLSHSIEELWKQFQEHISTNPVDAHSKISQDDMPDAFALTTRNNIITDAFISGKKMKIIPEVIEVDTVYEELKKTFENEVFISYICHNYNHQYFYESEQERKLIKDTVKNIMYGILTNWKYRNEVK